MKTDQYLSDKIKAARESENGEGWLTFKGKRCQITTKPEAMNAALNAVGPSGFSGVSVMAFVRSKHGIKYKRVHRHDGNRLRYTEGSRYLSDSDLMAVVIEDYDLPNNG